MKRCLFYCFSFVIVILVSSCAKNIIDCSSPDYSDCNTKEPSEGLMNIRVTINAENKHVPIDIYCGKLEENKIDHSYNISTSDTNIKLAVGYYYSVKAQYQVNGKTIYALDGGDVLKNKKYTCDSVCWTVKNGKADLRLK